MYQSGRLAAGLCVVCALIGSVRLAEGQPATERAPASADTLILSLRTARELALARSPAYLRERQSLEIADAGVAGARAYPFNPVVELETVPDGEGRGAREYRIALGQEVEWPGNRGSRIEAARAGHSGARMSVRDAARRTLLGVTEAYHTAVIAQRRAELSGQLAGLASRLLEVSRLQAAEGELSVMEANLAQVEAGRARAAVLEAKRAQTTALLELRRVVGLPAEAPIALAESDPGYTWIATLDADSLVHLALTNRPDLLADDRAIEAADALARLARGEAIPSVRLSVFVEREAGESLEIPPGSAAGGGYLDDPRFGFAVELPIPLFQRNQARRAEWTARLEASRFGRDATELAIRTEVLDAHQTYRAAREATTVFERDLLEPARVTATMLGTALEEGEIGLPEYLLLRRQLFDAEMEHLGALLTERLALARLESAVGIAPDQVPNQARNEERGNDDR